MYQDHFDWQNDLASSIRKLLLLAICGWLIFTSSALTAIAKSEKGWAIRQSSNFGGTVFSDITDHALKMHIGKVGLTIIAKSPKWNALVFNENSKTYIDLPYKEWQKKFTFTDKGKLGDNNNKLIVRRSGKSCSIEHFNANEYLVVKRSADKKNISEEKISQLWIATDIKAPPQIAQIFCSHLGIPTQEGIPLRAKRWLNGKMVSALETLSIERRMLSVTDFAPLPSYKKVKNEIQLFMGESNDEAMNDLLDMPSQGTLTKLKSTK